MPKRLTFEEVNNFVETKTEGRCKILSSEYKNVETPLLLRCSCGKTFKRTFHKLRSSELIECPECCKKRKSEKYRLSLNQVKEKISGLGCEYVSGTYKNNQSVLLIRCSCGNTFKKSLAKLSTGQNRCPDCGKKALAASKTLYSLEDVETELQKRGYTLLSPEEYRNCESTVLCSCKNGHTFHIKFSSFIAGHAGCKKCANEALKGNNHWNYKGGESEVIDDLRKSLLVWKKAIFAIYEGKSAITGQKNKSLVIHHLKPFMEIVREACESLNLPLNRKIKHYTERQYSELKSLVLKGHKPEMGIPLERAIHDKFHEKYGNTGNTSKQFDEFLRKNYKVSLAEVQRFNFSPKG